VGFGVWLCAELLDFVLLLWVCSFAGDFGIWGILWFLADFEVFWEYFGIFGGFCE